mmetsp:Transcript_40315/g.34037  ORF Transcript_40315/g.34037 Transcript_40315/m.34037 type:complete len:307 (-) Transcript_40315:1461-2381(-)
MSNSLLHDTGRLDDLRQKHFSGTEKVANGVHAVHERAFDDVERLLELLLVETSLFGIQNHKLVYALEEGMHEPVSDGLAAPLGGNLGSRSTATSSFDLVEAGLLFLGKLKHLVGGFCIAIQDGILAQFTKLRIDIIVDGQFASIHNCHVHTLLDVVVEEDRVHSLANELKSSEREGKVRQPPRNFGTRANTDDFFSGLDEVHTVVVMLFHTSANSQDVEIENNIHRIEPHLGTNNQIVGALADAYFVFARRCLAFLVECHDDDGCSITLHELGVFDKKLFADLERDGIEETLALKAFETCNAHVEL